MKQGLLMFCTFVAGLAIGGIRGKRYLKEAESINKKSIEINKNTQLRNVEISDKIVYLRQRQDDFVRMLHQRERQTQNEIEENQTYKDLTDLLH